ncbi:MAG: metallophosphoesterase [Deltaproteobacteria bacterium]|jgi:predicted phosphodiesterase|nr:metallophosphoesterase [Deltaproteobacteria bacterium]
MIWVIGDIHGMFDPLRRILQTTKEFSREYNEPIERIVFLGDYIDHGPCSKEVIDLIQDWPYDKVCLMGNHEDMALRFMKNDKLFLERNGNSWFINGYLDTYKSIFDGNKNYDIVQRIRQQEIQSLRSIFHDNKQINSYKDVKLPIKYEKFITKLRYSHQEILTLDSGQLTFSFFHALPDPDYPIDEQKVSDYKSFNEFLLEKARINYAHEGSFFNFDYDLARFYVPRIESSIVWQRLYQANHDFKGQVLIHGHTPTLLYRGPSLLDQAAPYQNQFIKYDFNSNIPFLFSRYPQAEFLAPELNSKLLPGRSILTHHYITNQITGLEAINIDTGAVYGGALTALGLAPKFLKQGFMPFLSVPTCRAYQKSQAQLQALRFDKLGYQKAQPPNQSPS